jgi:probable lipoprotein NlpC
MKTTILSISGLMALLLFFGASCTTLHKATNSDQYAIYSQKLGVKLNGNEDLNLLENISTWKGVLYRYGGNTKNGTDCSGFVGSVYKDVYGKKLHRSSKDMVNDVRFVSKKDLKAGDLIFFKINSKEITHVGIYIGENKFIHATTRKGVVIDNLMQEYYAKSFYKAGRVR